MLLKYINKYNEAPLGNIRNQDSIKNFEKLIERLTDAGDMTGAVQKFNDKISFKESRLKRYERFKSKLANMETNQDLEAFSHSVKPYLINFKQVNTQEEKHKLLEATYKELDQQISKYKTDIEQLKACIPSHYFKNLRSTN